MKNHIFLWQDSTVVVTDIRNHDCQAWFIKIAISSADNPLFNVRLRVEVRCPDCLDLRARRLKQNNYYAEGIRKYNELSDVKNVIDPSDISVLFNTCICCTVQLINNSFNLCVKEIILLDSWLPDKNCVNLLRMNFHDDTWSSDQ